MPMSGRFLLDTNIVIALLEGEAAVQDQLARADEVFVSSVALAELYFGAGKSGRPQTNLARVDQFASDNVVLGCDTDTARRYGEVKNALRLKGYSHTGKRHMDRCRSLSTRPKVDYARQAL